VIEPDNQSALKAYTQLPFTSTLKLKASSFSSHKLFFIFFISTQLCKPTQYFS